MVGSTIFHLILHITDLTRRIARITNDTANLSTILTILQTQDLRVDQEKESCIRVNTRELNRELCTGLSILYTKISWSMLTTSSLP